MEYITPNGVLVSTAGSMPAISWSGAGGKVKGNRTQQTEKAINRTEITIPFSVQI